MSSDSTNRLLSDSKEMTSYDIPLQSWLGDPLDDLDRVIDENDSASSQTTQFMNNNSDENSTTSTLPLRVEYSISNQISTTNADINNQNILFHKATHFNSAKYNNLKHFGSHSDLINANTSSGVASLGSGGYDHTNITTVPHGFFFGSESLQNLSTPSVKTDDTVICDNDSYMDEDEGISEVYGWNSNDRASSIRQSDRSFKCSPEQTPRHAISQRIGKIGVPGHHIGLGHRLGLHKEDISLIPNKITANTAAIIITEDSPVQIEFPWQKPENSTVFTALLYKIEACIPSPNSSNHNSNANFNESKRDLTDSLNSNYSNSNGEWQEVSTTRWPIFRLYHTDDVLFLGRHRVKRQREDVDIKLRVCCHGELSLPGGVRHWVVGAYSKTVPITFCGDAPVLVQQTSL